MTTGADVLLASGCTTFSGLAALFAGLAAAFDSLFNSVFLDVTGAFDFEADGFAAAPVEDLPAGAATTVGFAAAFATTLVAVLATVLLGDLAAATFAVAALALPSDLAVTSVLTTDFAGVFDVGFAAAGFAVLAEVGTVFAGFFIAFAMESTTNLFVLVVHVARHTRAVREPNYNISTDSAAQPGSFW